MLCENQSIFRVNKILKENAFDSLCDAFLEIKSTHMTVRFTGAPFKRALARRGEISTLGGLTENDGYPKPSSNTLQC